MPGVCSAAGPPLPLARHLRRAPRSETSCHGPVHGRVEPRCPCHRTRSSGDARAHPAAKRERIQRRRVTASTGQRATAIQRRRAHAIQRRRRSINSSPWSVVIPMLLLDVFPAFLSRCPNPAGLLMTRRRDSRSGTMAVSPMRRHRGRLAAGGLSPALAGLCGSLIWRHRGRLAAGHTPATFGHCVLPVTTVCGTSAPCVN